MNNKRKENILEKIPIRCIENWSADEKGIVTLNIENKGFFNKIAQIFFKKAKISHIHLDEMGSFIWPIIDGKTDIFSLGKAVEEEFGEKAAPLYERLAKYIKILESYGFLKLI